MLKVGKRYQGTLGNTVVFSGEKLLISKRVLLTEGMIGTHKRKSIFMSKEEQFILTAVDRDFLNSY